MQPAMIMVVVLGLVMLMAVAAFLTLNRSPPNPAGAAAAAAPAASADTASGVETTSTGATDASSAESVAGGGGGGMDPQASSGGTGTKKPAAGTRTQGSGGGQSTSSSQGSSGPAGMPGAYASGAIVGTNKKNLRYGDLKPYAPCLARVKYRGKWDHQKGQRVGDNGFSDGQIWHVRFPKPNPTTGKAAMVDGSFYLSDFAGPADPTFAKETVLLYHSLPQRNKVEELLAKGVELPPWIRSGPLAFTDLIAKYCKGGVDKPGPVKK